MIKVSVMYPYQNGARFDFDYYRDKHMPLLKELMGAACLKYSVEKGLAGGAPGTPPTYLGLCHFYCDTLESFTKAFGPHADVLNGDIPNYTDLVPVIQISEVLAEV